MNIRYPIYEGVYRILTMKEGDIVFLKRPYRGYRAVELIERLPYRWLVRVVESGLELEVYEDELTAEN